MRRTLLATLLAAAGAGAAVPWSPSLKLFGHSIKNGPLLGGVETTVFEHACPPSVPVCTVTQMHFPSIYPMKDCPWDWEHGRLRVYVDNATAPSVDVTLLQLAHVGSLAAVGNSPPADGSPFGHSLFGKTARTGGVYSTIRIPFGATLRVTLTAPPSCSAADDESIMWVVVRGIEGLPVTLGGELTLPDQARLSVVQQANVTLQPQQSLELVSLPAGVAGALVSMMLDASSADLNFLEGCVRLFPDDPAAAGPPLFASSGTEDYFLSASYFDEGQFTTSQSGLTYKGGGGDIAAYKTHADRDYITWADGFVMRWKNEEDASCPSSWPSSAAAAAKLGPGALRRPNRVGVAPATVTTLVWLYTWPSTGLTFNGVPA